MKLSGVAWRGLIWMFVGLALHIAGVLMDRPFVMRWTGWPWGLIVAALGAIILAVDVLLARRRAARKAAESDPEDPAP